MKKIEQIFIEDSEGNFNSIDRDSFLKLVKEANDVQDLELGDSVHPADQVVEGIVSLVEQGDELQDELSELQPIYDYVSEVLKSSNEYLEKQKSAEQEEKERKKKEKEEEKERKEKEKAELAERQSNLMQALGKGSNKAQSAFKKELESLKAGLPKGISIVQNDSKGFGLEFEEGITDDQLGAATGYFLQKEENSKFMQHTAGFFVGELCNRMVSLGIYPSKLQAAKAISLKAEEQGRKVHPRGIESYARMAERIPMKYRNSEVVDKAYLELANAKKVKKTEGESKEEFAKRRDGYEKERLEIAEKLANNEISEVKDVKESINKMQIKYGVKDAPNPEKKTTGDYLRIYFLGTEYIENLDSVHEDESVVFQEKGSEDQLVYKVSELKEMVENARLNLVNALINFDKSGTEITLSDLKKGSKKMEVPEVDLKGKPTGKSRTVNVDVFPRPFFDVPKAEKAEEKSKKDKKASSEEE